MESTRDIIRYTIALFVLSTPLILFNAGLLPLGPELIGKNLEQINRTFFNHSFNIGWDIYTNSSSNFSNCPLCKKISQTWFSNSGQRDLILTIALNGVSNVFPFVRTLRSTGSKASMVFLMDDSAYQKISKDTFDLFKNCSVRIYNVGKIPKTNKSDSAFALKHLVCYDFLLEAYSYFDRVMLVDLYDVYFQKDPFTKYVDQDSFIVAEEYREIGDDMHNIARVRKIYEPPQNVLNQKTLNGGLWFGSPYNLLKYYQLYFSYFDFNNIDETHISCDQGYLNYFSLTGQLKSSALNFKSWGIKNGINNLCSLPRKMNKLRRIRFGKLRLKWVHQTVVHQFDRYYEYIDKVKECCPQGNYSVAPAIYVRYWFDGR